MKHSESINEITKALTNMHVSYTKQSENPFFKSKYASLSTILEAIREPLAGNGLSVSQGASPDGNGNIIIETLVSHVSGQWIKTDTFIPVTKKDPQQAGSSITYGRRYALEAVFNLSAEDDDGNSGTDNESKQTKVSFEELETELSKFTKEIEVTNYMIEFKKNHKLSEKQIEAITKIGMKHLARVKAPA